MRSPNLYYYTILGGYFFAFAKAFLSTPGRTGGFVTLKQTIKAAIDCFSIAALFI
jgi:hypothetical protein